MSQEIGLQEKYSPKSRCFGCGPSNPDGLRIRSVPEGDEVVAHWTPAPKHEAFPGVLNGGIIGALMDCHSNWTTAWHLMRSQGLDHPPCTVTAAFSVKLLRPTPSKTVEIRSKVKESSADRATIDATLSVDGKVCATCEGLFVAVKPGHPAYHRW